MVNVRAAFAIMGCKVVQPMGDLPEGKVCQGGPRRVMLRGKSAGGAKGMARRGPVVLCILDGWGLNPSREANAVVLGDTPNFDRIWAACPHATLAAHGPAVGLPEGQMGNSEVGHTNIGAGRVVWMDLPRIDKAIADGSFARNAELARFIAAVKVSGGTAHVAGLASPGGVHAHQRHIVAAALGDSCLHRAHPIGPCRGVCQGSVFGREVRTPEAALTHHGAIHGWGAAGVRIPVGT